MSCGKRIAAFRSARLVAAVALPCAVVWLGPACSRSRPLVLDGLPAAAAAAFERWAAAVDDALRITTPCDGAVVPRNLAFPVFEWRDGGPPADAYLLELRAAGAALDVVLKRTAWRPERDEFDRFLRRRRVTATVYRLAAGGRTSRSAPAHVTVAERRLTDRVAFRVVPPLFDPSLPNALVVFAAERRTLATVVELEGTCVGCHVWSGGTVFLNVKRGGERRLVATGRLGAGDGWRHVDLGAFSFLAVSPRADRAVFVNAPVGDLVLHDASAEPFDYAYRTADLFVLDTRPGAKAPLPGGADPAYVEDMPSFSPDGRRVIFSRYRFDDRPGAGRIPAMALAEVPFNEGRGGAAVAVAGASDEGTWNYFARYAPNGRWISFCRGDASHGVYARRSSDIWLLPAGGGAARRLRLNAPGAMDSWHSWSSDSHWLAFSSGRDGGMTALYLAYVDEDGNDWPPVKVAGVGGAKVNTPQFVGAGSPIPAHEAVTTSIDAAFAGRLRAAAAEVAAHAHGRL